MQTHRPVEPSTSGRHPQSTFPTPSTPSSKWLMFGLKGSSFPSRIGSLGDHSFLRKANFSNSPRHSIIRAHHRLLCIMHSNLSIIQTDYVPTMRDTGYLGQNCHFSESPHVLMDGQTHTPRIAHKIIMHCLGQKKEVLMYNPGELENIQ